MKKSRFTEEQIAFALKRAESGDSIADICRKLGVSQNCFYQCRRKYQGMGISELRKQRHLEQENSKLKRLVADLSLDHHMLQELIAKML